MLAAREREQESSRPAIVREFLNPYWDVADLNQTLLESAQQKLAELPAGLLESVSSLAVTTVDYADGDDLPLNAIATLGASMKVLSGDAIFVPAQRMGVKQWFQSYMTPASITPAYAFISGKIRHRGFRLRLVLLVEPKLTDFQSDVWILPPTGTEEEIVDRAHRWLSIEDFMPTGRI